jgi:outer membrane protein OmpA-like peptidoglycan-associated protein
LPLALAAGLASAVSVHAQNQASARPAVEVDSSVLDQLGPPSNLPEMLLRQTPLDTQKVVLIPPKGMKQPANSGRLGKHHLEAPEGAPTAMAPAMAADVGVVHLHPIKPRPRPVKICKRTKTAAAPTSEARKETAAAAMTPTLAPNPNAIASEPLAPPPNKNKTPITTPVPPPAAVTPAPATAPAAPPSAQTSPPAGGAAVALTAQPTAPETAPGAAATQESLSTIQFEKESARLPDPARDMLAHLASRMSEDATLEVQLLAYAAGDEENASKARRLSLSRALAVRTFLIEQGVRSTRIEVRALGNKVPEGEPDRVDIAIQKRG